MLAMSSGAVSLELHDIFGNPTHPITTPDAFLLLETNSKEIAFLTRCNFLLFQIWARMIYSWSVVPRADKIARKHFGNNIPPLEEIYRKYSSLLFTNENALTTYARPNVPNVMEIDQIHIKRNHFLPQDLQEYLDQSKNGFVYFSLGTHFLSSRLNNRTLSAIVEAFSELPYNVLWKWEADTLPGKPSNVLIRKFFPQQDILAHPNIKVFVTQGGIQSIEESLCNGVPMVGIPMIADQPINVQRLVQVGAAIRINVLQLTKNSLKEAILEVANNQSYKKTMNKYRLILQDQPLKGVDKAIWWIEYVIRHKGAEHLKSPAADMSFIEYLMIDVVLFLITATILILYMCYKAAALLKHVFVSKLKTE